MRAGEEALHLTCHLEYLFYRDFPDHQYYMEVSSEPNINLGSTLELSRVAGALASWPQGPGHGRAGHTTCLLGSEWGMALALATYSRLESWPQGVMRVE